MAIAALDLEQLPLRSIVALGYLSLRRARGDFVVPAHVPNPKKFHKAVDKDLDYVREFVIGQPIDLKFALRRMRTRFNAGQAGHDIIYSYGQYAGLGPLSVEHTTPETRRAAVVAEAVDLMATVVYHFSFSVLSDVDPAAIKSIGFPVNRDGWAANGMRWTLDVLTKCEPSLTDFNRLVQANYGKSPYPALGEPVSLEV